MVSEWYTSVFQICRRLAEAMLTGSSHTKSTHGSGREGAGQRGSVVSTGDGAENQTQK